jgi:acetyltransferase-like isoleucine patch superfamily enzyme
VWIGDECALRCHEGSLRVGDRVVLGRRNTINAYLDVEIGEDVIFADAIYVTDFDHRYQDPLVPIQKQGIVMSPVRIGADCWIGEKVSVLRGADIGPGSVIGAQAVVKGEIPSYSVAVGQPARVVKKREKP